MDIDIEDGDGGTSDPLASEIRSSPEYQKAFLDLHTGTLEELGQNKAGMLCHLARGKGLGAKGRKYGHLMMILTQLVCSWFTFGHSSY